MLRPFVADLHIHTVLSPCADYRMVPHLITDRAAELGIDLIGVTDHNSAENAAAVMRAAERSGVAVLPGMEVETREGVHVITLFDDIESLECWQERVYGGLPRRENVERVFGVQLVVDVEGQLVRVNHRLLITATDISVEEAVDLVGSLGGLCIPAHVDRPSYGLLSVLGLLPPGLGELPLEISPRLTRVQAEQQFPQLGGRTLIRSSDAHQPEDIGRVTTSFVMQGASIGEVLLACRGEQGRRVVA